MAVRDKNILVSGNYFFITFTVHGWKQIFVKEKYCDLVYKWFDYMKESYGNKISVYVIMPNHIHLIIKLSETSPLLPKLISNGKRFLTYGIVDLLEKDGKLELLDYFSSQANVKKNARHKVFKERYDSLPIQSLKFFLQKLNYIHNNPCQEKWQLVAEPELYPHSSAANYTSGRGIYDVDLVDF